MLSKSNSKIVYSMTVHDLVSDTVNTLLPFLLLTFRESKLLVEIVKLMPYTVIRVLGPVTVNFYDAIIRYHGLLESRARLESRSLRKLRDKNSIRSLFKANNLVYTCNQM